MTTVTSIFTKSRAAHPTPRDTDRTGQSSQPPRLPVRSAPSSPVRAEDAGRASSLAGRGRGPAEPSNVIPLATAREGGLRHAELRERVARAMRRGDTLTARAYMAVLNGQTRRAQQSASGRLYDGDDGPGGLAA